MSGGGRGTYSGEDGMKVLIACEFSGVVREAFKARGHDAWSCDLMDTEIAGNHIVGNVLPILKEPWDLIIAHPPCTYLTVAGNKWMKPEFQKRFPTRLQDRLNGIEFFMQMVSANAGKIAIENPVGIMSKKYRKPDQIIQPYQFGHTIRKTTCLWLKNLPLLTATKIVKPELDKFPSGNTQSKWHTETGHIKDRHERMKARSRTHQGIADAMAEQWGLK